MLFEIFLVATLEDFEDGEGYEGILMKGDHTMSSTGIKIGLNLKSLKKAHEVLIKNSKFGVHRVQTYVWESMAL